MVQPARLVDPIYGLIVLSQHCRVPPVLLGVRIGRAVACSIGLLTPYREITPSQRVLKTIPHFVPERVRNADGGGE